jgi:hypothetical protein
MAAAGRDATVLSSRRRTPWPALPSPPSAFLGGGLFGASPGASDLHAGGKILRCRRPPAAASAWASRSSGVRCFLFPSWCFPPVALICFSIFLRRSRQGVGRSCRRSRFCASSRITSACNPSSARSRLAEDLRLLAAPRSAVAHLLRRIQRPGQGRACSRAARRMRQLPQQGEDLAQHAERRNPPPAGAPRREKGLSSSSSSRTTPSSARAERGFVVAQRPLPGLELRRRIQHPALLGPVLPGQALRGRPAGPPASWPPG